ncbi:MAG: hypothetical protein JW854_17695 [Actinobacteria bacterium]|nr:hypothetical protein [Actinomycetota bacterium]
MEKAPKVRRCPQCGVPKRITKEYWWLDNGTIVEKRNPAYRMMFIENENITGVFDKIEDILGISIEHIITASQRISAYDYANQVMPGFVNKWLKIFIKPMAKRLTLMGRLMGFGDVELLSLRYKGDKGDYVKIGGRDVFYLPAYNGIVNGSMEAVSGHESSITYEETSPGYYEITASVSTTPKELKERFQWPQYANKRGDLGLERCPSCGGPRALSDYEWRIDGGTIVNRANGRRMILLGPGESEAVFDELEKELGEEIPQVVIEAQRRFVKSGFYPLEMMQDEEGFREQLALRGLGNLVEFDWGKERLQLRWENPCMHLLLIGLAQGLFELVSGQEGRVEWQLADGGDLKVEVSS